MNDWVRDGRQLAERLDRMHARAGNGEVDRVVGRTRLRWGRSGQIGIVFDDCPCFRSDPPGPASSVFVD